MAISLLPATKRIYIPKADLTVVSAPYYYQLDIDWFRLQLRDLEDNEEESALMRTHNHVAPFVVGALTLARVVEILPPWQVEFEDGQYQVDAVGGNHNIGDRKIFNQVGFNPNLSAGYISVTSGSGLDAGQDAKLTNINDLLNDIEGTYDHRDAMRLLLAVLVGKVTGAGTGTERFRDIADTKDRIISVVDSQGNRSNVTRDET